MADVTSMAEGGYSDTNMHNVCTTVVTTVGNSQLLLVSTLVRSLYPGANFASVVRPIPAGPGQTLSGGCIRDRNTHNKFSAKRFAHFFIIEVPEVGPGFAT